MNNRNNALLKKNNNASKNENTHGYNPHVEYSTPFSAGNNDETNKNHRSTRQHMNMQHNDNPDDNTTYTQHNTITIFENTKYRDKNIRSVNNIRCQLQSV